MTNLILHLIHVALLTSANNAPGTRRARGRRCRGGEPASGVASRAAGAASGGGELARAAPEVRRRRRGPQDGVGGGIQPAARRDEPGLGDAAAGAVSRRPVPAGRRRRELWGVVVGRSIVVGRGLRGGGRGAARVRRRGRGRGAARAAAAVRV
ncbi:hypothetical protein PVAP13_8KG357901 [Panicum virgatum]|uniref:Uncharacterized protein n=1 Tax=Panicum virgatum TaxID=38727 RepID=A0A8T0PNT1_PANVG|nr:hypothetical protein PVAP13_8KG357901 [Panicum virgatum]